MDHVDVQKLLLDRGWTRKDLELAVRSLRHVEHCHACASVLDDYDRLREVLSSETETATETDPDVQPAGGWDVFEQRLTAQVGIRHTWRWRRGGAAIAALLLVGVGIWIGNAIRSSRGDVAFSRSAALLPADPQQQASAFQTVSRVFDGRAGWVALSNNDSRIGLNERPVVNEGKLVLLRLTVAEPNRVLSQTDLVILPGQEAELSFPVSDQRTLNYRVSVNKLQPDRVAVWAEVQSTEQHTTVDAVATSLNLREDRVYRAGQLMTGGGTYDVSVGFRRADSRQIQ